VSGGFGLAANPFNRAIFAERGPVILISLGIRIAIMPIIIINGLGKFKNCH
jgi:hypothetical protein